MANVTVDSSAELKESNRSVIRDSNDNVYVVVETGSDIKAYKGNVSGEPASFAEQDSGNNPTGNDNFGAATAIDSTGLLHIAYYFDDPAAHGAQKEMLYATFRTSAHPTTQDVWNIVDESIVNLDDSAGNFGFTKIVAMTIDADDVPHISYIDETKDMGNDFNTIYYINRIGGSWATGRVLVTQQTSPGTNAFINDIFIGEPTTSIGADRPIIVTEDFNNDAMSAWHGTALDASAFTESADITGTLDVDRTRKASMCQTENGNITIAFVEDTFFDLHIVEHLASNSWGTWETPVEITTNSSNEPSIAASTNFRYVYVEDASTGDIDLWKEEGSGWVEETADADLPNVGTFDDVKVKWDRQNNNSPRELDYVFNDGAAVLYNTFQGAAPPAAAAAVRGIAMNPSAMI